MGVGVWGSCWKGEFVVMLEKWKWERERVTGRGPLVGWSGNDINTVGIDRGISTVP